MDRTSIVLKIYNSFVRNALLSNFRKNTVIIQNFTGRLGDFLIITILFKTQ